MTLQMEKDAAKRATEPVVRPWSVTQVRGWKVSRTLHDGDVAIRVEAPTFSEIVSYRDRINSRFTAPGDHQLEEFGVGGKPLSLAAAKDLYTRILPIVNEVNGEERVACEAALEKLVAAGAVLGTRHTEQACRFEYQGGSYTVWGCTGGANKVSGLTSNVDVPSRRWIETTVEELLQASFVAV